LIYEKAIISLLRGFCPAGLQVPSQDTFRQISAKPVYILGIVCHLSYLKVNDDIVSEVCL